ncbi:hypothetical protein [Candidatus Halobonum tyrrellensis]|uniref:Uncharacterized protein n=1 Tax=Candidatus Halobonum tyrrellensis G22 TaxID=1324957 RepID=V4HFC3_9EURY|nr:hypothetical protein [Candidatus Halobonum tyrrellensis]ESP88788.1 hypothetical protein K933_07326 [Candidatus Halobonum tyrrellensis G22]
MPSTDARGHEHGSGRVDPSDTGEPTGAPDDARRFPTKRGECVVGDDAVRIEGSRLGYLRNLRDSYWRSDEAWRKAVFLGIVVGVPLGALNPLFDGVDRFDLYVYGATAALVAVLAGYQRLVRGFTTTDRIPLSAVREVALVEGTRGVTRPRFVVRYDDDGRERRRYVHMPSPYTPDGGEAVERGRAAFAAAGVGVREE